MTLAPGWQVEWVTLFACALDKTRARKLLEELSGSPQKRALSYLEEVLAWTSSERKAMLAREFGEALSAAANLRAAFQDAGPLLQARMLREMAPYQRSLLPKLLLPSDEGAPPALQALAERWVHAATREPAAG